MARMTEQERKQRAEEAHRQLVEATDALMSQDGWRHLIEGRRWLRKYSLNNLLMIMMQCPEATDVRPYGSYKDPHKPGTWLAVGRHAVKGSHSIKIWAPRFRRVEGEENPHLAGFLLVSVFDVSQTEGEPLPETPSVNVQLLTGDAPALLWERTEKLIAATGYTVVREKLDGKANGRTYFDRKVVAVRPDVEDAQAVKTLIHEYAHIKLGHQRSDSRTETEAESVACIVTSVAGLDSMAYSVPYVAGWAGDAKTVAEAAKSVLRVADEIIAELDIEA